MNIFKRLWGIFSGVPHFAGLIKRAMQTGKVEPVEALKALSSFSPGFKKCADTAMNTAQNGGGIPAVAQALTNIGEIEVLGQKINTRTLTQDLRKSGGICSLAANILDGLIKQTPEEIVKFGEEASEIKNWEDFIKN